MNTFSASSGVTRQPHQRTAWWREPYLWLVVGGPLVVVVAAIVTAVIAFEKPDPVISHNDYQQAVLLKRQAADHQQLLDDLAKLQPAHQARNHAASPVVPGLNVANKKLVVYPAKP